MVDGALARGVDEAQVAFDARRWSTAALSVAADHSHKLQNSLAGGWVKRAERLLADLSEAPVHGYLARARVAGALGAGDLDGGVAPGRIRARHRRPDGGHRFESWSPPDELAQRPASWLMTGRSTSSWVCRMAT
ncbi:MAG: hypothetical protein ABIO99_01625 [Candidatus Limnocylindria bacterium]